jgi:predicted adenine nucleotide alpha hydrolase (AANH) superfamily ATPase
VIDSNKTSLMSVELIAIIIEKQRLELTHTVEKYQYNFQKNEVIAASIEMDHWLNLYQQSFIIEKSKLKS